MSEFLRRYTDLKEWHNKLRDEIEVCCDAKLSVSKKIVKKRAKKRGKRAKTEKNCFPEDDDSPDDGKTLADLLDSS